VPQVEVTFDIDTDGVVHVSAKDLGTGKSQEIVVTASSGLTQDAVEDLVKEAASHAQDDKQRRAFAELRNRADGLIYSTERMLSDYADHVSAPEREALDAAVAKAREMLQSNDTPALEAAVDELTALSYKMTEKLYSELGGGS